MDIFILAIIGAAASAFIAMGKNRNAVCWALAGFCFPLIGFVAVCCLPPNKPSAQLSARAELKQ